MNTNWDLWFEKKPSGNPAVAMKKYFHNRKRDHRIKFVNATTQKLRKYLSVLFTRLVILIIRNILKGATNFDATYFSEKKCFSLYETT
jgi:hypothetical protein